VLRKQCAKLAVDDNHLTPSALPAILSQHRLKILLVVLGVGGSLVLWNIGLQDAWAAVLSLFGGVGSSRRRGRLGGDHAAAATATAAGAEGGGADLEDRPDLAELRERRLRRLQAVTGEAEAALKMD
jgi:hypothetical protein